MIKASQFLEYYQIELVEKLEDLLDRFYADMLTSGLKPLTAERHIANAELFLIEYHAFYFLDDITTLRPEKIYDFLGVWYFQKIIEPTENDILGILTSLRRFFSFAAKEGALPQSVCHELKKVCHDKNYFIRRFHQYEYNPDLCFLTHRPSQRNRKQSLRECAKKYSQPDDMDVSFLDSLIEEDTGLSLEEMISQLMQRFQMFQPRGNVISLEPYLYPERFLDHQKNRLKNPITPTIQTLKDHCLTLHRANLVFMRWLDRYNCPLGDLPAEAIAACLDCDGLLACLLAQLNVELITSEEINLGHRLLDMMDKMLWKARYQIARFLGLDLRSLPL